MLYSIDRKGSSLLLLVCFLKLKLSSFEKIFFICEAAKCPSKPYIKVNEVGSPIWAEI